MTVREVFIGAIEENVYLLNAWEKWDTFYIAVYKYVKPLRKTVCKKNVIKWKNKRANRPTLPQGSRQQKDQSK